MNKHLLRTKTLSTKTTQKYFNFSRDKEYDGIQFLQIAVTTTKLLPYKHISFFMKCVFCTKFIMVLYWTLQHVRLCQVFANRVTYELCVYTCVYILSNCYVDSVFPLNMPDRHSYHVIQRGRAPFLHWILSKWWTRSDNSDYLPMYMNI